MDAERRQEHVEESAENAWYGQTGKLSRENARAKRTERGPVRPPPDFPALGADGAERVYCASVPAGPSAGNWAEIIAR
jgi:hypothetical protein